MPDRNHAFDQGPLIHPKGLGPESSRGSTGNAPFVNGGPLITLGAANKSDDAGVVLQNNNEQEMYINQVAAGMVDDVAGQITSGY